jgi:hypothetical protein
MTSLVVRRAGLLSAFDDADFLAGAFFAAVVFLAAVPDVAALVPVFTADFVLDLLALFFAGFFLAADFLAAGLADAVAGSGLATPSCAGVAPNSVSAVPHTAQLPRVKARPEAEYSARGFTISRLVLHFTQYACMGFTRYVIVMDEHCRKAVCRAGGSDETWSHQSYVTGNCDPAGLSTY